MKITKRQLRRLIREADQNLLKEQYGNREVLSPLVGFAQAWSGLGSMVQEQIVTVVNGYIENNPEDVYEINPNALDTAYYKLSNSLNMLGESNPDAEEVMEALDWAKGIFEQGEAEVEADRLAAEE